MAIEALLRSVTDTAKILGISPGTVGRMARKGRIGYRRIGDRVLFSESDIQNFIESCAAVSEGEK